MKEARIPILAAAFCTLLSAAPVASSSPAQNTSADQKSHAARNIWAAENTSGKIISVTPEKKLVVAKRRDGVTFNMLVTPKSQLKVGSRTVALKDLAQYKDKDVSVEFIPEHKGDVVQWLHIAG